MTMSDDYGLSHTFDITNCNIYDTYAPWKIIRMSDF